MTEPTERDLRNAGVKLRMASILGTVAPAAVAQAVREDTYYTQAQVVGVGREEARAVLCEVIAELVTVPASGDPYEIAYGRIMDGLMGVDLPNADLRAAARQLLAASGSSLHPDDVVALARQLQRLTASSPIVPWYRRLWRRMRNAWRRKS